MHLHKITPPIKQLFTDPFTFTLTFDNPTLLPSDLEFTITYTGSPDTSRYDQLICTEHIGPVPAGRVAFDLVTDPVRVYDLPLRHLFGVTSVVIIGRFGKCEFLRIGYFVKVQVEGVDDEKLRFEDEEESGDEIDESCDNSEDVDGEEDNEDVVEGEEDNEDVVEGEECDEIIKGKEEDDDIEDGDNNDDTEDFGDDIEDEEIIEAEEIIEDNEDNEDLENDIQCKDNLDGEGVAYGEGVEYGEEVEDDNIKNKKIHNDLNINNDERYKNVQVNENLSEQFNNQKTLSILKDETLKCVKEGFQESKPKKNKKFNSFVPEEFDKKEIQEINNLIKENNNEVFENNDCKKNDKELLCNENTEINESTTSDSNKESNSNSDTDYCTDSQMSISSEGEPVEEGFLKVKDFIIDIKKITIEFCEPPLITCFNINWDGKNDKEIDEEETIEEEPINDSCNDGKSNDTNEEENCNENVKEIDCVKSLNDNKNKINSKIENKFDVNETKENTKDEEIKRMKLE